MRALKCALFEGLSDEECVAVAKAINFEYKTFSRDDEVFVYGRNNENICCLIDGVCETVRTDEDGTTALIEKYPVGSLIGYASASEFSGRDYVAVIAKSKCVVGTFELGGVDFSSMPYLFLKNLFNAQTVRAVSQIRHTGVLLGRTIRDKLMCYFKNCAEEAGSDTFELKTTLSGLADYIFADRSAMMREIKKLREEGIVKIERKTVTIITK